MNSVLERYQQQGGPSRSTAIEHGVVTDAVPFGPVHATIDEAPVRISMFGNVKGFSPGFLCTDQTRRMAWVPIADVRIIDPNYLPLPELPVAGVNVPQDQRGPAFRN
jgi:hypothetical protein